MWASAVVKGQIAANPGAGVWDRLIGVKINLLVFDRAPEPLDEDVVAPGTFAVHGDADFGILQHLDEVDGRELASLVVLKMSGLP